MIIRIARHGQPELSGMPSDANPELPPHDYPLSELGRKQAAYLGRHLADIGFRGMIISSPYARTVETADLAAADCGQTFYLDPRLQEMRFYPDPPCLGMTLAQIQQHYPRTAPDATLQWPWITPGGVEELEHVRQRVDRFVEELIRNPPDDDILLVGHGASVQSLKWNLCDRCHYTGEDHYNWNCSLSGFQVDQDGHAEMFELARFDFMPLEIVTSNKQKYGDPE